MHGAYSGACCRSTPNLLTVVPILLVPVLVVALLDGTTHGDVLAAIAFALASLTDAVDGYLARSRNAVTTFGKLMDPVADKLRPARVRRGGHHRRVGDRLLLRPAAADAGGRGAPPRRGRSGSALRLAAALAAVVGLAALAAGVVAVVRSHDTAPDDVEACVRDAGGRVVEGQEGLAFARSDIERGRLRRVRAYRLGADRAVLLRGAGYGVLVVGIPEGPPLGGRDLARRLYTDTASFATVATERAPVRGVLDRCARRAGG